MEDLKRLKRIIFRKKIKQKEPKLSKKEFEEKVFDFLNRKSYFTSKRSLLINRRLPHIYEDYKNGYIDATDEYFEDYI